MILLDSIIEYVRNYSYNDDMEVTLFDEDKETNVYLLVDVNYKDVTYNITLHNDENQIYWTISRQNKNRTINKILTDYKDYDYLISLIEYQLI